MCLWQDYDCRCCFRDCSSELSLFESPLMQNPMLWLHWSSSSFKSWSFPCGAARCCSGPTADCSGIRLPKGWDANARACLRNSIEFSSDWGLLRKSMEWEGSCSVSNLFAITLLRSIDVGCCLYAGCILASMRCWTRSKWNRCPTSFQCAFVWFSYPYWQRGASGSQAQKDGEHSVTICCCCCCCLSMLLLFHKCVGTICHIVYKDGCLIYR